MSPQYDDQELVDKETSEHNTRNQERVAFDMEALADKIASIARNYVREALVTEARIVAAEAWNEEATQALDMLLSENQADIYPDDDFVVKLAAALKDPGEPDDEQISEHANELGDVMAPAWLQYLSFALENGESLILDTHLLPIDGQGFEPDLSEAFQDSLNSFAIGWEDVPPIMKKLGMELFERGDRIELPLDILIDRQAEGFTCMARPG